MSINKYEIMMKKISICFGIMLSYCLMACSGNDDVESIRPWTEEIVLPQGKSDADDRIVDYYEKFGTYILYDYTYLDFNYEVGGIYEYKLPDPVYVGDMLDLLEEIWFDLYPVDFHKKYMPLKIMLADYLISNYYVSPTEYVSQEYFILSANRYCFALGFCSDTLKKISPATKCEWKNAVHSTLWGYYSGGVIEFPEEFFAVSDYSRGAEMDPSSEDYTRNRGFLADQYGTEWSVIYADYETGLLSYKNMDVSTFLQGMVTKTTTDWEEDLKYPLVKQKYDILRNWIQETFGFDLQNVGDTTYE